MKEYGVMVPSSTSLRFSQSSTNNKRWTTGKLLQAHAELLAEKTGRYYQFKQVCKAIERSDFMEFGVMRLPSLAFSASIAFLPPEGIASPRNYLAVLGGDPGPCACMAGHSVVFFLWQFLGAFILWWSPDLSTGAAGRLKSLLSATAV